MSQLSDIRAFWLDDIGPQGWYMPPEGLDAEILRRYGALWDRAMSGDDMGGYASAEGTLAMLILLDQFPRNMFRDTARAFASDERACAIAKWAIARRMDQAITGPARQFFYMPLMHSESLQDQQRCVRLFLLDGAEGNLTHARAHREVIRRYGRFPTRNAALGRRNSVAEQAYLDQGGYGQILRDLS